jgi:hypothetical protein
LRDWSEVQATHSESLIGSFAHPSFGVWTFDENSNVKVIPSGTQMSTPFLEHLYGESRPIVASLGDGQYKGVLEWTPGYGQDHSKGKLYGYRFDFKATSDAIEISNLGVWPPGEVDTPAVFHRT